MGVTAVKHSLMKKMIIAISFASLFSGVAQAGEAPASTVSPSVKANQSASNKQRVTDYMHALFVERDLGKVETFWGKEMIQHNPTMI
ncbi:hypothetical protein [Dickeya fangzhongdai]|uniref:SnoaL-like domain-containing protein n=2 Tax=Dickeya fangzhongdai TaxID=1778540 RepID=A0A2K8QPV5_9GAMM|nr:hypothetical protein [Dickeya fangzhongdai]ATZ95392.1 hypothetical protein CVE23_16230 [Dickeya fangzhongdai]QOH48834.1 hypothetical protein DYD82_16300 [Dickeya fangzhongdai]QOH53138.1 hypothetical protein DYD83_16300 [Dickeya fangzhongdai]GGC05145.1 hypothetical protein GCM10007171_22770 [Dickeya fangzhongdai]